MAKPSELRKVQRIWDTVGIPTEHKKAVRRQDIGQRYESAPNILRPVYAEPEYTIEQDAGKALGPIDFIDPCRITDNMSSGSPIALGFRIDVKARDLDASCRQEVHDFNGIRLDTHGEYPWHSLPEDEREDLLTHEYTIWISYNHF